VQQDSEALNLAQVLGAVRRRAPLILLCIVVVAGAAFAFSKHQTKQYTATASVVFSNDPLSQQVAGLLPSSTSSQLAQQASNIELVGLGDMAAKTARLLDGGLTEEKVGKSLSIAGQGESNVVSVSATATSPVLAAKIANTYTRQFVKEQQGSTSQFYKSALALVNRQIAELPESQRFGSAAVALQNRAQTLRLLKGLKSGNVQLAQVATAPSAPSSPKTSKNTILGGLVGLFLGLGIAFVLERLYRDRLIGEPEDLEKIYRLPLLGTVPASAALGRSRRRSGSTQAVLAPAEAEAFHLIRARLRFFNVDRDLRTVLITSAARDEGKTTISRRLAETAARMGSRVLLLEGDFRNPTLAQQLDLHPGPGLSDVLIGTVSIDEATRSINLEAQVGNGARERTLDVLLCGATLPPNPGELIESRAMEAILEHAKFMYDLVVVDTPPLTAVSDAFPLLDKVDGVVVVGQIGSGRRDLAEQLHQTLQSSSALQLGVIANGVKSGAVSAYAYDNPGAGGGGEQPSLASTNGASSPDVSVPRVEA
jgi:capsular exopolysaccharide synthesis family protein